ncbi:hypothetical protein [Ponticoccus alexandrii]|uniref:Capsule biosynthesis protein n=1 Tax=Ponticoccus alexandrii TaxID=1943633 RepID=A0ABX7F9J9_9RHOB|nr:hypothetical protein [Ponticoccus alexandrii]KID12531.1 hypothetical protein P279_27180 [Rhodobacteraceae bacterium PD-2]QRF66219.1 hypothetical protein GQA70_07825 [Ponticoccus alexandrii]
MTQTAKTDEDRIAAWREQRAAIAAADKAARLGRSATAEDAPRPAAAPQDAGAPEAERAAIPDSATDKPPAAPEGKAQAPATEADRNAAPAGTAQAPAPKATEAEQDAATTASATKAPAASAASDNAPGERTAPAPTAPEAQAFLDAARAGTARTLPPEPRGPRFRLVGALALLPVLLTGLYLGVIATPLYEARSVIAITRPGDAGNSVQAGLLGGEKPVNLQDVFRAATFIKSRALMQDLEAQTGFVTEVSGPALDPLRRLRDIPALSITRHGRFDRYVETSVDVQSGLLTLYVRAPDPDRAVAVSEAVLTSAEAQVARLGQALFDQRRADAALMRESAEAQVREAQARLLTLQMRYQDVDPRQRVENIYARIRGLEEEAYRTRTEVQKAQIAGVGENRQTANLEALALQLDAQIRTEREQLVAPEGTSATPLNTMLAEYDDAALELELAREAVREAIEAEIAANREAALNRSIFQVVVQPDTDDIPAYPRSFGTILTVLIASIGLLAVILSGRGATAGVRRP